MSPRLKMSLAAAGLCLCSSLADADVVVRHEANLADIFADRFAVAGRGAQHLDRVAVDAPVLPPPGAQNPARGRQKGPPSDPLSHQFDNVLRKPQQHSSPTAPGAGGGAKAPN